MSLFQPASKRQLRALVALEGPTGSGKTWTALEWATVLADGGRVAVVDTENGSASYYADRFRFDVLSWPAPYDTNRLRDVIGQAAAAGYAVLIIDSLTHFWSGEGGILDVVNAAGKRAAGNQFAGWAIGTPQLRALIDTMRHTPIHVIATMRSKMEYVQDKDDRSGRTTIRKVGMAPEMRAGIDYEFTVVGELNTEHELMVTKTRCAALDGMVAMPGRAGDAARTFAAWLSSGDEMASPDVVARIRALLDAFPDGHRAGAKHAFIARFGRPDELPASQSAAALEWVDAEAARVAADDPFLVTPPAEPEPAELGPFDGEFGEPAEPADSAPLPLPTQPGSRGPTAERARKRVFALMKEHGLTENDRRAATLEATGGSGDSMAGLGAEALTKIGDILDELGKFKAFSKTHVAGIESSDPDDPGPVEP